MYLLFLAVKLVSAGDDLGFPALFGGFLFLDGHLLFVLDPGVFVIVPGIQVYGIYLGTIILMTTYLKLRLSS